jgi:hypothetical protein
VPPADELRKSGAEMPLDEAPSDRQATSHLPDAVSFFRIPSRLEIQIASTVPAICKETLFQADEFGTPVSPGFGTGEMRRPDPWRTRDEVARAHGMAVGFTLGLVFAWLPRASYGQEGLPQPWNAPRWELAHPSDQRSITLTDWAARLVEALGLAASLPLGHDADDLYSLLCPDRVEREIRADGRSFHTRHPFQISLDGPRSSDSPGVLRLAFAAPATAPYTLKVRGEGAARWYADHQSVGIIDPTLLGEDIAGSLIPLSQGPHQLEARLAPGARVERVELVAQRRLCIAPAEGWRGDRVLRFGDKARTLVQAFGLEGRLPVEKEMRVVEGEHFLRAGAGGIRTTRRLAVPASADAWAAAREGPTEFSYRVALSTPGLFSILARIHGGERQIWTIDGRYATRIFPPPEASAFAWVEVATIPLAAGEHAIRALLPDGAGVDVMQLLRRRTDDEDYLRILAEVGLEEGAASEPVTAEDADSNLRGRAFQSLTENFLVRDSGAAGDRLALVEHELEQLFTRPLSPVLPADL